MASNLSIAQAATLKPIGDIAKSVQLSDHEFEPLGRYKAKLTWEGVERLSANSDKGKLVLVTAMTPTPSGEGKTTVTVGLSQGLRKIGRTSIPAIREPALGPIFGTKGGAAGGGYSQVLPMEDINLFFNGDYPAIQAAHNLLSAQLDASLHHGNALGIDVRRATWPRTMDMNDRAIRHIVIGLGGPGNGFTREDGFVITAASEVMAILALSNSIAELKERLGSISIGMRTNGEPVYARETGVHGAMTVLLRDALRPNIVQTIEGGPAFVHCGPFANIAHGCSSILGTKCGLGLAEFTVTEAGFASDLGAEKFLNIVAPRLGRGPNAIVLVVTVRALKHHGGGDLALGCANMQRHIQHLTQYGPPVLVAINKFKDDDPADLQLVEAEAAKFGAQAIVSDPWNSGGEGCRALAEAVAEACDKPSSFKSLYEPEASFTERLDTVVKKVYRGAGFSLDEKAERRLDWVKKHGLDHLPVCMAKTQYSFSDDPEKLNAPEGFTVRIREIRPSTGAGFLVAVAGEMLLMPGLGKTPAALGIDIDQEGKISGLF